MTYQIRIIFSYQNSQIFEWECDVPALPRKKDIFAVQGLNIPSFKSGIGRVREVIQSVYTDLPRTKSHAIVLVDLIEISQEMTINVNAIAQ